jgi:DNA polymerase III epsilon subunit-like protein
LQAAWIVYDRQGKTKAAVDTLINPGQQSLDIKAEHIHGLDAETITSYGITSKAALHMLREHVDLCRYIVAYNLKFDIGMIERDALAVGMDVRWLRRPRLVHVDLMQIAADRGVKGDGKWIKLRDAIDEAGIEIPPDFTEHDAGYDSGLAAGLFWHYYEKGAIKLW